MGLGLGWGLDDCQVLPQRSRVEVIEELLLATSIKTRRRLISEQIDITSLSGTLYVFFGRGGRRVKVLWWDANGYCLLAKRLHRALFVVPSCGEALTVRVDGAALGQLLRGVSREVTRQQIPAQLH